MRVFTFFAVATLLASLAFVPPALAEPYLGFYLTGVPSSEHDIEADRTFLTTGVTDRFTAKDAKFSSSIVYGGVVGYRFLPFLAVEADVYHLNPGLKAQTGTATSPTVGSFQVTTKSGDLDLTIVALQLVGSYGLLPNAQLPEGQLQLYGGAGLAIFFADVDSQGSSANATLNVRDKTTEIGPQVKIGGRWFFTKNVAAFLEGRYAHTQLNVEDTGVTDAGLPIRLKLESDINLPLGLLGVSLHFR
jgi:opacity protein-like surface antigen